MEVRVLDITPLYPIEQACSKPYRSKASSELVERVYHAGHRSIARHAMASFDILGVSVNTLIQLSRHPHVNLTVESARFCDMAGNEFVIPPFIKPEDLEEYIADQTSIIKLYEKWANKEGYTKKQQRELSKLFLQRAIKINLTLSGNYQALYEFLQLRNCVRAEWEIRQLAEILSDILKFHVPEIFNNDFGCKGDEIGLCPERDGCGKYLTIREFKNK